MKKFLTIFLLFFSLFFNTFAYQGPLPEIYISNVKTDKTIYAPGDTIKGSFLIKNYDTVVAPKIYYEIKFTGNYVNTIAQTSYGHSIMNGPLTLDAKENRTVSFEYKLPETLSGKGFGIQIQSMLENGTGMGWGDAHFDISGTSSFVQTGGAYISTSASSTKTYSLQSGPMVYKGEKAYLNFRFDNTNSASQDIYPKLTIYDRSEAKNTLLTKDESLITAKAKKFTESKIELPTFEYVPKVYVGKLEFFNKEGKQISNTLDFRYIVFGQIVTVNNIISDEEYAKKGETVRVSVDITGAPFDINNGETATSTGTVSIKLINENNKVVGEETTPTYNFNENKIQTYSIPLTDTARSLRGEVKAYGIDGSLLNELTVNLTKNEMPKISFAEILEYVLAVIIVLLLLLSIWFAIKKKHGLSIMTLAIALILIIGWTIVLNTKNAAAWTEVESTFATSTTNGHTGPVKPVFFINNAPGEYMPGEKITVQASAQYYSCTNEADTDYLYVWGDDSTSTIKSISYYNVAPNGSYIYGPEIEMTLTDCSDNKWCSFNTQISIPNFILSNIQGDHKIWAKFIIGDIATGGGRDYAIKNTYVLGFQPYTIIGGLPSISLSANPTLVNQGGNSTRLTWSSTFMSSCEAKTLWTGTDHEVTDGVWNGPIALSTITATSTGSTTDTIDFAKTYIFSCLGRNGQDYSATATVSFLCSQNTTYVPDIQYVLDDNYGDFDSTKEVPVPPHYTLNCSSLLQEYNECNERIASGEFNNMTDCFNYIQSNENGNFTIQQYNSCLYTGKHYEDNGSCYQLFPEFNGARHSDQLMTKSVSSGEGASLSWIMHPFSNYTGLATNSFVERSYCRIIDDTHNNYSVQITENQGSTTTNPITEETIFRLHCDRSADPDNNNLLTKVSLLAPNIPETPWLGCSQGDSTPNPVRQGLTGYWPLNETDGQTAIDSSGNSHNLAGINTEKIYGKEYLARSFSGIDSYLTRSTDSSFNPLTGSFTTGVWVKTTSSDNQPILSIETSFPGDPDLPYSSSRNWLISQNSEGIYVKVNEKNYYWTPPPNNSLSSRSTSTELFSDKSINDNLWHYVAFTFDSGSLKAKLYIDGLLTTDEVQVCTNGSSCKTQGTFPTFAWNPGEFKVGGGSVKLDDVSIWNRVLTQTEISGLYNTEPVTCGCSPSFSWEPVLGANSYDIYKGTGGIAVNLQATSYTDTSTLIAGQTYSYKVKACNNSGGCSDFSNPISIQIPLSCQSNEVAATSICTATQTGGPGNGKVYVNKQMQWSLDTNKITSTSTNISTRWSGTSISGEKTTSTTTYKNLYTTVGLKTIYATSTWTNGNINYTAACSTSTNVILGGDIIKEI